MKGFGIEIKNNLLDPKHIERMGIAVWLYMFFIDKMTSINEEGIGKVLGGKPIRYEDDVKPELGISERSYQRWMGDLKTGGYINVTRTPYGLSVSVNKAFKRFGKSTGRDTPKVADLPKRDAPHVAGLGDKSGGSNKTVSVDNNKDTGERAITPSISEFFESEEMQGKVIAFMVTKGIGEEVARGEVKKFVDYWTEPNKSGKEVRWQGEKYFDLRRRLTTWFKNVTKFNRPAAKNYSKFNF